MEKLKPKINMKSIAIAWTMFIWIGLFAILSGVFGILFAIIISSILSFSIYHLLQIYLKKNNINDTIKNVEKIEEKEIKTISSTIQKQPQYYSGFSGILFVIGIFLMLMVFLQSQTGSEPEKLNEIAKLQAEKAELENKLLLANQELNGAQTPPYTVAKGREFKTVFKKRNGELVYWTLPADSLENSFARENYKQEIIPALLPILYATTYNTTALKKIKDLAPKYLDLKHKNGVESRVMDFREYVESNDFNNVISSVYDPKKSDEENIREIVNINAQLTSYSFEIKETPRYPIVTIVEGGGDCEDTAIFVASLLKAVPKDWNVQLVYMDADNPSNAKKPNHVLVYVKTNAYSTLIETTNPDGVDYWKQPIEGWYFDV